MSKKMIDNWKKLAEYDLETAKAMLKTGRYLYVAFTCQQCIEKILKAFFVKEKNETPPYTHNIVRLANELTFINEFSEKQIRLLEFLNTYYIESRYTEQWSEISKNLNNKSAMLIFDDTKKLFAWLIKKI